MIKPIEIYWKIRLEKLKEALEANNFEIYLSDNAAEAKSKKNRHFRAHLSCQNRKGFF